MAQKNQKNSQDNEERSGHVPNTPDKRNRWGGRTCRPKRRKAGHLTPTSTCQNLPRLPFRSTCATVERTRLANERTVLAYLRSALTLIIAGFSLM